MSGRIETPLGWHFADLQDFEFKLVVRGEPIVLKNSKQIVTLPGRRPLLLPSSAATKYLRAAAEQLNAQWASVFRVPVPLDVEVNAAIRTYLPTRRRTDASNLYEAVQDAMKTHTARCKPKCNKHGGVLVDDFQIRTHDGSDRLYDREDPRVEVTLTPYRGAGDRGQVELALEPPELEQQPEQVDF